MTRFGAAPGRVAPSQPRELSTTEDLARHSLEHGAVETLAEVAKETMRTGIPSSVTLIDSSLGEVVVRTPDAKPRDPRTLKQLHADDAWRAHLNGDEWRNEEPEPVIEQKPSPVRRGRVGWVDEARRQKAEREREAKKIQRQERKNRR